MSALLTSYVRRGRDAEEVEGGSGEGKFGHCLPDAERCPPAGCDYSEGPREVGPVVVSSEADCLAIEALDTPDSGGVLEAMSVGVH